MRTACEREKMQKNACDHVLVFDRKKYFALKKNLQDAF